jgi:predicted RNA-binding protein
MCEFKVFLDREKVFEGAVYAKATGTQVSLKDILGTSKQVENARIVEVDVTSERLILTSVETP